MGVFLQLRTKQTPLFVIVIEKSTLKRAVNTRQTQSGFVVYSFFILLFDYCLSIFNLAKVNKT